MADMLSGGDMLIRALQDEGVEYLFGYPGGAALHIYDAIFKQQRIEHILVRHEQAATHMADGYARVSHRPGIAMAQSVGAANLAAGLQDAYLAVSPVIAMTGRWTPMYLYRHAYQEIDRRRYGAAEIVILRYQPLPTTE